MTRCPNPSIDTSLPESIAENISSWLRLFPLAILVNKADWLYNLHQERRLLLPWRLSGSGAHSKETTMAFQPPTASEQIFWHLSVASYHLQAALDHAHAPEILTPAEYLALEAAGHEIGAAIERIVDEDDDGTGAP